MLLNLFFQKKKKKLKKKSKKICTHWWARVIGTRHRTLGEHRTCQTSIRPRNTTSNRLFRFFPTSFSKKRSFFPTKQTKKKTFSLFKKIKKILSFYCVVCTLYILFWSLSFNAFNGSLFKTTPSPIFSLALLSLSLFLCCCSIVPFGSGWFGLQTSR